MKDFLERHKLFLMLLFLAAMLALFGEKFYLGAALAQIIFSLFAITALYTLTLKLSKQPETALIAALLTTITLSNIVYTNMLLSDSLAQSFMAFMLYFYADFILDVDKHSCLPVGYGSYPRYRLGISMPLTLLASLGISSFMAARFRR
jgi:hypothetical protein